MFQDRRRPVVALLVAGVVGVAVVSPSIAGAAARKKCPRGWRRVRWSSTAPAGKNGRQGIPGTPGTPGTQGPAGPAFSVKDSTGATVGQYMGLIPEGVPFYAVLRDGGFYYYIGSGQVYPLGSPDWKLNDCSGTAYFKGGTSFSSTTLPLLVGGPFRMIFRTLSAGAFGTASAWKGRGTIETVAATQLYRRNGTTGLCETDGAPYTGDIAPLDSVTAPPDFVGPLTVG